jgi:hypothetical protein
MNQTNNHMYVTFDPESGKILGCSGSQTNNSLAIDTALGEKFIMGTESIHKYKVIYLNGQYQMHKDGVLNTVENVIHSKNTEIINQNVYKIPDKINNHSGIQIKLYLNQNKIEFTADQTFKKTLESIVSKENHRKHKFYCCQPNDATQLIQTLDLNLYELLTQNSVQINVNATHIDIYCRKIFDYSVERIYA